MKKNSSIAASFVVLGGAGISVQIIILRELLSAFYGNELSIGTALAGWLLLVSVGSFLSGRLSGRLSEQAEAEIFTVTLIILALLTPAALLLSKTMKHVMGLMPGEIVGFGPAFYLSLASLGLFCLPYGFLFPLGARIISRLDADRAKSPISAYFFEAAGTTAGGALVSLILIKILMPFDIVFILSLFLLITALFFSLCMINQKAYIFKYIAGFFITLNIAAWIFGAPGQIEKFSDRIKWRPFNPIKSENSIYGNITAVSEKSQIGFYISGGFAFAFPDQLGAEEAIHYPMAVHPKARDILLIGGGLNGALGELYKYKLNTVDYVELDPILLEMAKDVIGESMQKQLSNPALNIYKGDGRFYIKTVDKKYDIIILAVPAPRTIQMNRFYTREFFNEAKKSLKEKGILSLICEGGENYIGPELRGYLGAIYNTLKAAGFDIRIIPGENIKFIAGRNGAENISSASIQKALDTRGVKTAFVSGYYLDTNLSPEKIRYAEMAINPVRCLLSNGVKNAKNLRVNTDFKPISYYYDMVLWAASFQPAFNALLKALNERVLWCFILSACFLIILLRSKNKVLNRRPVIIAVITTGFTQMAVQISIMLAFQAIYGYLYYKLGLIMTLFMMGLFVGSFTARQRINYIKDAAFSLKKSKIALGLFSLFLIPIFKAMSVNTHSYWASAGSLVIFPALIFITGLFGGAQFSLASKVITKEPIEIGRMSGILYGADLAGGAAGALLLTAILIPIMGIFQCLAAVGFLNLASAFIIKHFT